MNSAEGGVGVAGGDGAPDEALQQVLDELVDEASMESFPASDPPSFWARE